MPQEYNVGSRTQLDVNLTEDAKELDEIIVTGYAAVKKSDLTGAVGSVKGDVLLIGADLPHFWRCDDKYFLDIEGLEAKAID